MNKPLLKTPISYYGGKQKLVSTILPLLPSHKLYAEPFCGGAAVFFAKAPSVTEVINDTNRELINFYSVLKRRFNELERMVSVTLHSRGLHRDASVVYNNPHLFDEIKRAWAIWVLSVQSFSAIIDGSWGYDKSSKTTSIKASNKRESFIIDYANRLQNVQIECSDALYIIQSRDQPDAFFYCDPPYIGSNCGHYDGYTEIDYEALLKSLAGIKGKFLLSSYPSAILQRFIKKHGWYYKCYEQGVSVNAKSGYHKRKWEMLVGNYDLG